MMIALVLDMINENEVIHSTINMTGILQKTVNRDLCICANCSRRGYVDVLHYKDIVS